MPLCCKVFARLNNCTNGDEADVSFIQTQKRKVSIVNNSLMQIYQNKTKTKPQSKQTNKLTKQKYTDTQTKNKKQTNKQTKQNNNNNKRISKNKTKQKHILNFMHENTHPTNLKKSVSENKDLKKKCVCLSVSLNFGMVNRFIQTDDIFQLISRAVL